METNRRKQIKLHSVTEVKGWYHISQILAGYKIPYERSLKFEGSLVSLAPQTTAKIKNVTAAKGGSGIMFYPVIIT